MTVTSTSFSTYTPCSSSQKILTVDGSSITMVEVGDIHLSPSLVLKNVLQVPKLTTNLVSVYHFLRDTNCVLIFYPTVRVL